MADTNEGSDFILFKDMLPEAESSIPLFGLRLLLYYDKDGSMLISKRQDSDSDVPITTVLGALQMASFEIALDAYVRGRTDALKRKKDEEDDL